MLLALGPALWEPLQHRENPFTRKFLKSYEKYKTPLIIHPHSWASSYHLGIQMTNAHDLFLTLLDNLKL